MTMIALFLVALAGWLFLIRLQTQVYRLERAAIGWCLGISVVTFLMFVASALGIRLTSALAWGVVGLTLLAALVLVWFVPSRAHPSPVHRHSFSPLQVLAIAVLLLVLAFTVIQGNYWPIYDNDSLSTYDFRARLMVAEGTMNVSAYQRKIMGGGRFYPPLVPMAYTLVYLTGGSQPKIVTSLFWLSLVAVVYARLRHHTSRWPALVFTLVMALSPQHLLYATHGMTNIPFAAYLTAAVLYLLAWDETGQRGYFWLGAMLLSGAAWTRSADGLLLTGMVWTWVLLHGPLRKRISLLTWIAGGLLVAGPALIWQVYVVFGIGFPAFTGPGAGNLQLYFSAGRMLETGLSLVKQLLDPRLFGLSGVAFVLGLVLSWTRRSRPQAAPLLGMIASLLLAWVALFYFVELENRYQTLYSSGQRLLISYTPILVYFAGRQKGLTNTLERLDVFIRRWWNGTA